MKLQMEQIEFWKTHSYLIIRGMFSMQSQELERQ